MKGYLAKDEVVILDFETSGLSTDSSRIIEVGAAIVKNNEIIDTYQSLCNPGHAIPSFITGLTGITTAMVAEAPSPEQVMDEFRHFLGDRPVVAHNASFDTRFLRAEMGRIGHSAENPALCTMLLSRRLLQDCDNHKLGTIKEYIGFQEEDGHRDHRALDDVKVTAVLWMYLRQLVEQFTQNEELEFRLFQELSRVSKYKIYDKLRERFAPVEA